jgi:gamma-glutamyltranspeptidase / glutathione hydrolase
MPHPSRIISRSVIALWLTFALPLQALAAPASALQYDIGNDIISPVVAKHGMVASDQALATQVGVDILKRGGNAVDAAVAVGFALAVVKPNAGNIGGGGFMLIHDAKSSKDIAIDFRETAPALASVNMYLDANGNVIPNKSLLTHQAVGVPGTIAGLDLALRKYGTMRLSKLIAPAIKLAQRGFTVSPQLADTLASQREHLAPWTASRTIFFKGNRPLEAGETLVQKDLARSLQLIAIKGANEFYRGSIAKKIVAEMRQHQGLISMDDLANYKAIEREPVRGSYRGYDIISMPPPSSGGAHIVQMLNILERYPLKEQGSNSAQTLHQMAEAMKLAYADRSEYLGDPDFVNIPLKGITSRAYADELAKKILPDQSTPSAQIKAGKPAQYESDQTTQYTVADAAGNLVSTTYTLNFHFGSGIVASGTGIVLNDEMDDFSAKPGVPNVFGLVSGTANAIAAGKRPLSSMSPTFVLKDGKPFLATGSPGGSQIITSTLQIILNVIDHGMNVAEATTTPRIHHQWLPDVLRVERGISADTLRILKQQGHTIKVDLPMGKTQTIQIRNGGFYGYSDPRSQDGKTAGF